MPSAHRLRLVVAAGLFVMAAAVEPDLTNPTAEAKQLLWRNPADAEGAERLLRSAVARNPSDAQTIETLALLLMQRAGDATVAAEAQQYAGLLRRHRESRTDAKPSELALALELEGHLLRALGRQAESNQALDRAVRIRKSLVRDLPVSATGSNIQCVKAVEVAQPPRLVSKREPAYSDEALLARHQGVVSMQIAIDVDGSPKDVQLLNSLGFGLDEEASAAVKSWKFEPGKRDGQPVAVCAQIEVNFRLL